MYSWDIQTFVVTLIVLATSMPVHECAHAWAARRLGDDTACQRGRLTLNPLSHLDLVGSVMLLLTQRFGWAKPTPVDPRNFTRRVTVRGGMALTALAGPVSNLLLAFLLLLADKLAVLGLVYAGARDTAVLVSWILLVMVSINVSLAIFNLLPIPPLDGYRIFSYFLPDRLAAKIQQNQQLVYVVMLVVLFMGFLDAPIGCLCQWVLRFFAFITHTPELVGYA